MRFNGLTIAAVSLASLLALICAIPAATAVEWTYTVKPGDNPWNITTRMLAGIQYWPRIQALNDIRDPLHMPPGMRLRIPQEWLRPQTVTARVATMRGDATLTRASDGSTIALQAGAVLATGDLVRTATQTSVTLEFGDGSRVLVHPESALRLTSLRRFQNTPLYETELHLESGRVENEVRPLGGEPGRFEITTPAAITSVRGTDFRIGAEDAATLAEVTEGGVGVTAASNRVDVPAGFGTKAVANEPPRPPVQLLPAPATDDIPTLFERRNAAMVVPTVAGAAGYRLQVAPDGAFNQLLQNDTFTTPTLRLGNLADGDYVLRLRAIDAQGIEGLNADHVFRLNAIPEPPLVIAPAPGAILTDERPAMRWAESVDNPSYHLQLATDDAFNDLVLDVENIAQPAFTPADALAPGIYYWRLQATTANDGTGPFGDAQQFRRIPPAPGLSAPEIAAKEMVVRWQAGDEGDRYEFQLARDEDFDRIIVSEMAATPGITLPRPRHGTYYMRVRTLFADGIEGPFGTPQKMQVPVKPVPGWAIILPFFLFLL
ncbi:MAG: FecR domain-containing protein [Gammaproteobacteria bacterium]|nr:FecR domain-containing protein [Gammaproteobacteria bacterium]